MSDQRLSSKEQNSEVQNLIVPLTHLLQNCDTQSKELENTQLDDPLMILVTRVNVANAADQDQFACLTQLYVEKPETYAYAMQGPNAAEWAKAMEDKLDQLEKNNIWELVYKADIQPGY